MTAPRSLPFDLTGELTLLDLVLAVDEFTRSDAETALAVSSLLASGRVRLRDPLRPAQRAARVRAPEAAP